MNAYAPHEARHLFGGSDVLTGLLDPTAIGFFGDNLALGITPTAVGTWTTPPNNLINITDGDPLTLPGNGVCTYPNEPHVLVDLGAGVIPDVVICVAHALGSDGSNLISDLCSSPDNSAWTIRARDIANRSAGATILLYAETNQIRYWRLHVNKQTAGTGTYAIKQFLAARCASAEGRMALIWLMSALWNPDVWDNTP